MRRRVTLAVAVAAVAIAVAWNLIAARDDAPSDLAALDLGPDAVALGAALYADNCGACHGADLAGEPGFDWRQRKADGTFPGPPHNETGHTWHHPDGLLIEMIAKGGAAFLGGEGVSGMPDFADVLSPREIASVLAFIKASWPQNIQERQRQATEASRQ